MIIKKNIVFMGICCTPCIIPADQHPDQAIALMPCMPHPKKKTPKAPLRSILVKKTTPHPCCLCSCFFFACLCSRFIHAHAPTSPPQQNQQHISKKVIIEEEKNSAIAEPLQKLFEEIDSAGLCLPWPIIAGYLAEEPPCDKVPTFHELTVEIVRTPKNKDTRLELSIIRKLDKIYDKPAYKRTLCEVRKTWNKHYPEQESDENFG